MLAAIDSKTASTRLPLYQVQSAYNGIAVQAAPGRSVRACRAARRRGGARDPARRARQPLERPADRRAPGVGHVRQDRHGHERSRSSTPAWTTSTAGFGGSGSSADYLVATQRGGEPAARLPTIPARFAIPGIYPSAKVVGGFDFAGDTYTGSGGGADSGSGPEPDGLQRPRHARVGHGGRHRRQRRRHQLQRAVQRARVNTAAMGIGPGVAPQASSTALRVFGCAGSTALTTAASTGRPTRTATATPPTMST